MKIKPITVLRDTNKLSEEVHLANEPIFITKNGYNDLVIMSPDVYDSLLNKKVYFESKPNNGKTIVSYDNSGFFGLIKVGTYTPRIKLGNIEHNAYEIIKGVKEASSKNVSVLTFPELCLTGYTFGDCFTYSGLMDEILKSLETIVEKTKDDEIIFFIGAPLKIDGILYDTSIAISKGQILAIIPKNHLVTYGGINEERYFKKYLNEPKEIAFLNKKVIFGTNIILKCENFENLMISVRIGDGSFYGSDMNLYHDSATLIVNLSASDESYKKDKERRLLINSTSLKGLCCYCYSNCGEGESSTDFIYSGHSYISCLGEVLIDNEPFSIGLSCCYVDFSLIMKKRKEIGLFNNNNYGCYIVYFPLNINKPFLDKSLPRYPFLLNNKDKKFEIYDSMITSQAMGLKVRLDSIYCQKVVIGLSGGLDSTLALFVAKRCFDIMKLDSRNIFCVTLPCFGTSQRTYNNALKLSKLLNVSLIDINISCSVEQHLKDINHDFSKDIAFENAQARERTQVLMDYANKISGLVVGTGDLSEMCLGWCTFNGDHMSNYNVNCSIPKTLVKELVRVYAVKDQSLKEVVEDIVNTPISPELIPSDGGIYQKSEDNVGPYDLIDYYIYCFLYLGYSPRKILFFAEKTFEGIYDIGFLKHWLKNFFKRFFSNQFKRSCSPDGAKVHLISLSPRGSLSLSSDVNIDFLVKDIDEIV